MQVFVVDGNAIYRRGLVASLERLDGVDAVREAGSIDEATGDPDLVASDVVVVDGGDGVVLCGDTSLPKDTLTPERLALAVRAAAREGRRPTPDLLARLRPTARPELTERERRVLALIAAGHPTREVAEQLSYSERTVKNVLHDVVVKLNARTRSHAVACAVREGLI